MHAPVDHGIHIENRLGGSEKRFRRRMREMTFDDQAVHDLGADGHIEGGGRCGPHFPIVVHFIHEMLWKMFCRIHAPQIRWYVAVVGRGIPFRQDVRVIHLV